MSYKLRPLTRFLRALQTSLLALACGVASPCVRAGNDDAATTALSPELRALLAELPRWSYSAGAHAGVGFKDNVVLSHINPQGSGFTRSGADFFLWRTPLLPDRGTDYFAIGRVETTQFFRHDIVDHEGEASLMAEWRYRKDDTFTFAADVNGLYFDQVLDVSDTDIQRVVIVSKKTVARLALTARWSPRNGWWGEVQVGPKNERYRDGFNNARVEEGSTVLGWRPLPRLEMRALVGQSRRSFSTREQYSIGGRPLAGTQLRIIERDAEARFDFTLDEAGQWKATTRFGKVDYTDNGAGFFDYRQTRVRQRLEWKNKRWTLQLEGTAKRRDFAVQTVGVGISPPLLVREKFDASLHLERKLSDRWSVYLDYFWERSRSNEPIASYRMNEGLLGATWSWEK